jgi:signal transduction histidine kinase
MTENPTLWLDLAARAVFTAIAARYCAAFVTPRGKLSRAAAAIGFGVGDFASVYLISAFFVQNALSVSVGVHFRVVAAAHILAALAAKFLLISAFFRADAGLKLFLVASIAAVQDLSTAAAVFLFAWLDRAVPAALAFWGGQAAGAAEAPPALGAWPVWQYALYMAAACALGGAVLRGMAKSFRHRGWRFVFAEWLYVIVPCLLGAAFASFVGEILVQGEQTGVTHDFYGGLPYAGLLIPLACGGCLLCLAGAVRLMQKIADLHREERRNALLHGQTAQLRQQMLAANDMYAELKGMRHDVKSHAANIGLLARAAASGNPRAEEELTGYLGKLEASVDKFDFAVQTEHPVSDMVIQQKYREAAKAGIRFEADFLCPASLGLDPYELAVILGNALENAIEACLAVPERERSIRLRSYVRGNLFFLECENSFVGERVLSGHTGLPLSGKEDPSLHGMGLENIRRCARKHLGDIDIQITRAAPVGVFRLTVMLQGAG